MDAEDAHPDESQLESRPPTLEDLISLCRNLNAAGARYLVIGGMAIIQHGFTRTTEDVDLLLEGSPENQARVLEALDSLPDQAARELAGTDLRDYVVVRIADEIVVDLMLASCGIAYEEACAEVVVMTLGGVPIPFATPRLLLRMKQTVRDKDAVDRSFLYQKLAEEERSKRG
ncbi:MAG: hypothetical protein JO295_09925 [Verrucomicrobia bacterium]|nr:hypothetical protein [Verrucomicrobiota bacterium]